MTKLFGGGAFLPVEGVIFNYWRGCFSSSGGGAFLPVEGVLFNYWRGCFSTIGGGAFQLLEGVLFNYWRGCFSTIGGGAFLPYHNMYLPRIQYGEGAGRNNHVSRDCQRAKVTQRSCAISCSKLAS